MIAPPKTCAFPGCKSTLGRRNTSGFCKPHFPRRFRLKVIRDSVSLCECGSHGFFELPHSAVALFSPQDIDLVRSKNWIRMSSAGGDYVGFNSHNGKSVKRKLLHRLILRPKHGLSVDHKNRDRLDNRRENLRCCTHSQNAANALWRKDSYKGVWWKKTHKAWSATIRKDQKTYHLGCFADASDAARAYDKAALELFGEFALTNKMLGLLP